jgi:hypothetical protein
MKYLLTLVIAAVALAGPAGPVRAAAEDKACAAQDLQLFYYYLSPMADSKIKERLTACHPGKTVLQMPAWLEKDAPVMLGRKVWKDPEEGELSEAALWQTPVSILYEFADKIGKAETALQLEPDLQDMRLRFNMSVDRLTRANLESSFYGRGGTMLATLDNISRDFDELTQAVAQVNRKGSDLKTAELLRRARDLFAQLFEAPRQGAGKKPASRYTPEARILPGYRGVSLGLPGSQALFLEKGDRVDMLVTFEALMGGDIKEKVTATILQNVLVTGVQKPASAAATGVVQLLCNPNEAQYAALSLAQGSNINLVRRAPGDLEMRPMEIASFRKLIK